MPTEPLSDDSSPDDLLPVDDNEMLMRRVLESKSTYARKKDPPLQAGAFLPRKTDNDGLSLNRRVSDQRKSFLAPDGLKNWHEVPSNIRETCGVVAVMAAVAREIGLTVKPDPATTPGHVLIEEINWDQYAGDKQTEVSRNKIEAWALQLARRAEVLIPPGKLPAGQNSTAGQ